jgi:protease-4
VKTNRFTDYEDNLVFSKDNEAELLHVQHYVDRGYEKFLSIVAQGRKMSRDEVHTIAQGRVWLASDAINIKLVDQLGSLDDAIKKAAELAKSEKYYTTAYPGQEDWMDNLFKKDEKGSYLDSQLRTILGDFYEPIMEMRLDQQRNRLQARLPFTTTIR